MRAETVRLHSHHTIKVKIPSTCRKRLQGRPPVYRELLPNGATSGCLQWERWKLIQCIYWKVRLPEIWEGQRRFWVHESKGYCTSRKGVFQTASAAIDKWMNCDLKLNCQHSVFSGFSKAIFFCLYHKLFPLKGFKRWLNYTYINNLQP